MYVLAIVNVHVCPNNSVNQKIKSNSDLIFILASIKVHLGNDQEKAQSERNSHSKNRVEK